MSKQLQYQKPNERLSPLRGEFINSELENRFIQAHWGDKTRQIRIVLIISTFAYLLATYQNYLDLHSTEHFFWILLARIIQFVFFAWSIYACRTISNITSAQLIIFATEIITAFAEVIETLAYHHAPNYEINLISAPFFFFIIVIYYAFISIRWSLTTLAALIGGGLIIASYVYIAEGHLENVIRHPVMLLGIIAIGGGVVRSMNISQRQNWLQSKKLQHEIIERRRAEEQASQASKAKSEFLAVISHEIRTPLNAILAMSETLSSQDEFKNQNSQRQLNTLKLAGSHLNDLIENVLDFSSIESRTASLSIKPLDIAKTVNHATSSILNLAQQKNLELIINIEPSIPKFVLGDEKRIRQILINLVGNAIKFTEQGQIKIHIYKAEKTLPNGILLRVQDSGIGIPEADLSKIFEPFQQADYSSTRSYQGTGLGLAISSELVKQMNGKIDAYNHPDGGAIFDVILPLPHTDQSPEQVSSAKVHNTSLEYKVLIIEDSELNQAVFREYLKNHDCTLHFYQNGLQALERLKKEDYDIIFMDLHMPDIDGITISKMIRSWEKKNNLPSTPILMISADSSATSLEKAKNAGVNKYLNKPLSKSALFNALIELLPYSEAPEEPSSTEGELTHLHAKFFNLTSQHIEALYQEISRQNPSKLALLLHTVKGHCQIFGFSELTEAIEDIQTYIENNKSISYDLLQIKLNKFENQLAVLKSLSIGNNKTPNSL